MSNGRDKAEDLKQRIEKDEPLVDTPVLNMIAENDLPLRGDIRQKMILRIRENVRDRRTIDSISSRAANAIVSPVRSAVEGEASERIQNRIKENVQRAARNTGGDE